MSQPLVPFTLDLYKERSRAVVEQFITVFPRDDQGLIASIFLGSYAMGHVVLLGDSIFDNGRYVPGNPAVIEQVRAHLPAGWLATLSAVDGAVTADVARQLRRVPADATHLFVSAGGNDALRESDILKERVETVADAFEQFSEVHTKFRIGFRDMLQVLEATAKPFAVATIYDAVPDLLPSERTALALFNDVILHEACRVGAAVIDLRLVCVLPTDYSHVSPIEPSFTGGLKISRVIAEILANHDFNKARTAVYW